MPSSPKTTCETQAGKGAASDLSAAFALAARHALLSVLEDVEVRAAIVAVLTEAREPVRPGLAAHVTRAEYARRSSVSEATVSRWLRDGMPSIPVGSTVRIEIAAADAWRQSRGRVPTRATAKPPGDIEVEDVLSSAGLRLVANGGWR